MEVPILHGVYTDNASDFRVAYPKNMIPIAQPNGISPYYLRPAEGIEYKATGPGIDRGGIEWNGACYRVMGTKLVRVNSDLSITTLGDVGGGEQVKMDYSFDYLAIASSGKLYLWNGTTLQQITDSDLGTVVDFAWVDGYFLTTDGESLVVTELNDPFSVNPLKYGSSEADPDPVLAVLKFRGEIYAMNRHTIEVFNDVGGANFPFARVSGAQVQRGVIGTHCCAILGENIAFVGSGRNESPAVFLVNTSNTVKISTREIDTILSNYSESVLSQAVCEAKIDDGMKQFFIHLPDQTLVFDEAASRNLSEPVWFRLSSGLEDGMGYTARNFVWCYDKWIVGNPTKAYIGTLTKTKSTHWGNPVSWEFSTRIAYNSGSPAIFHSLELVALPGRSAIGSDPYISTSWTTDGMEWSQPKFVSAGKQGQRTKRIVWFRQGMMRNWRIQRFRGTSDAHLAVSSLQAKVEPLNTNG